MPDDDSGENGFGGYVKSLRTTHKLTVRSLAKIVGVSAGYITQIEKGVSPSTGKPPHVKLKHIRLLAKALRVPEQEMIDLAELSPDGYRIIVDDEDRRGPIDTIIHEAGYDPDSLGEDEKAQLRGGIDALIVGTVERQRRERQKGRG